MSKSKQIQNMYFGLLNDKLYQIWRIDQTEKEIAEMVKQFGCEPLFDNLKEHNRDKRKKLTDEAEELFQTWRESL